MIIQRIIENGQIYKISKENDIITCELDKECDLDEVTKAILNIRSLELRLKNENI